MNRHSALAPADWIARARAVQANPANAHRSLNELVRIQARMSLVLRGVEPTTDAIDALMVELAAAAEREGVRPEFDYAQWMFSDELAEQSGIKLVTLTSRIYTGGDIPDGRQMIVSPKGSQSWAWPRAFAEAWLASRIDYTRWVLNREFENLSGLDRKTVVYRIVKGGDLPASGIMIPHPLHRRDTPAWPRASVEAWLAARMDYTQWITINELAKALDIGRKTLSNRVAQGGNVPDGNRMIPHPEHGQPIRAWPRASVEAWFAAQPTSDRPLDNPDDWMFTKELAERIGLTAVAIIARVSHRRDLPSGRRMIRRGKGPKSSFAWPRAEVEQWLAARIDVSQWVTSAELAERMGLSKSALFNRIRRNLDLPEGRTQIGCTQIPNPQAGTLTNVWPRESVERWLATRLDYTQWVTIKELASLSGLPADVIWWRIGKGRDLPDGGRKIPPLVGKNLSWAWPRVEVERWLAAS